MKSEHRHELKTNELAEWIANFPQWFKSNLRTIIYVSIIIVVAGGSYFYRSYQKNVVAVQERVRFTNLVRQLKQVKSQVVRGQMQGRDLSYAFLQPANALLDFAENSKDINMAAFGLIKYAEAIRMELHYRLETVSKQETAAQIAKARSSYSRAIEKLTSDPDGLKSLLATAKLGLGLCEEEVGRYGEAEKIYGDMISDSSLEGTAAVVSAQLRIETMSDYQTAIAFKPAVKKSVPITAPSPLEQIIEQPAEVNLSDQLQ